MVGVHNQLATPVPPCLSHLLLFQTNEPRSYGIQLGRKNGYHFGCLIEPGEYDNTFAVPLSTSIPSR